MWNRRHLQIDWNIDRDCLLRWFHCKWYYLKQINSICANASVMSHVLHQVVCGWRLMAVLCEEEAGYFWINKYGGLDKSDVTLQPSDANGKPGHKLVSCFWYSTSSLITLMSLQRCFFLLGYSFVSLSVSNITKDELMEFGLLSVEVEFKLGKNCLNYQCFTNEEWKMEN